ncbi:metallopeptidase family protein [Pseudoroseomonas wenyumeiae]
MDIRDELKALRQGDTARCRCAPPRRRAATTAESGLWRGLARPCRPARLQPCDSTAPSAEDLLEMAEAAFAAIPDALREAVRGTALLVEDLPDEETLQALGLEHPWEAHRPVPRHAADAEIRAGRAGGAGHHPALPRADPGGMDRDGEDLYRLVRNVLIHEIGHHFGFSDDDIARLEGEG